MLDGIRRFAVNSQGDGFISSPYARTNMISSGSRRNIEMASIGSSGSGTPFGGSGSSSQNVVAKNTTMPILEGFLPDDLPTRNRIFRDIYHHDAVAGTAVDVFATLPWSDFRLTGMKDIEALDIYHKSVESMRLKILLPALSREYQVFGRFVGSTIFDEKENVFSAVMPQNNDFLEIIPVPVYGMDPLINLKMPSSFMALLNGGDERARSIMQNLPEHMREHIKQATVKLKPENTLFIPRRTLASDSIGTSYYERLLPIHLMEKAVFRGSIDQYYRRLRAILHITVGGDGDDYVPTTADLEAMRDTWMAADADPTGAIILTRNGVQPSEVRSAGDFVSINEMSDVLGTQKYRALGIDESLINQSGQYTIQDASMTIFIENLRAYRDMITQEVFYEKIFPVIALANEFTRDKYIVTGSFKRFNGNPNIKGSHNRPFALCSDQRHGLNMHNKSVDTSALAMPKIVWQKELRPVGSQEYMTQLKDASDMGLPVPISMLMMAAGLDLSTVIEGQDEEIKARKAVKKYMDKIAPYAMQPQNQGDDSQGPDDQAQAALATLANGYTNGLQPMRLNKREFPETALPHNVYKNGKFRNSSTKSRTEQREKIDRQIARVMANINEREIAKNKARKRA